MRTGFEIRLITTGLLAVCALSAPAWAAEPNVNPGINRAYENADYERWVRAFESEGREAFDQRHAIVAALELRPGMVVADVGAGTGLFTRLMAPAVQPGGQVVAVDITESFVENTVRTAREQGLENVSGIVGTATDTGLEAGSVDLVFTCDTYHHFEYPQSMLDSIRRALRPGGQLIVIDYEKIAGFSSPWVMGHVRADKQTVIREIEQAGFTLLGEETGFLRGNYFLRFGRDP
jgi:ubiquinone/menaquinone biosynthesis C-methylase UbiE